MTTDARGLYDIAQGERSAAAAWLSEGKTSFHREHIREALRLEVLARHSEGGLTAFLCGTAVVMAETWHSDDLDELIAMAEAVLRP